MLSRRRWIEMIETVEDYIVAYVKHYKVKLELIKNEQKFDKEESILENIVEGAVLKFNVKRKEFEFFVDRRIKEEVPRPYSLGGGEVLV